MDLKLKKTLPLIGNQLALDSSETKQWGDTIKVNLDDKKPVSLLSA